MMKPCLSLAHALPSELPLLLRPTSSSSASPILRRRTSLHAATEYCVTDNRQKSQTVSTLCSLTVAPSSHHSRANKSENKNQTNRY